MEYFFDADKPHWGAWLGVYDIDQTQEPPTHGGESIIRAHPIYYAALCGFYGLAEYLAVKNPEHVNAMGGRMITSLWIALYEKHFQVAELLHLHGADVNIRGSSNWTSLHSAARDGHVDIVRWLLDNGADVNVQNDHGTTPILLAAYTGQLQICRMLLEHNANITVRGWSGMVPLHAAASQCPLRGRDQCNIMQLLLNQNADTNARDNHGSTPLHYSSGWEPQIHHGTGGTIECLRLLLKHGADIDAKNDEGKTALQVALEKDHHERAEFLLGIGAK
jgi:ankyrin repeat protein